MAASLTFEQVRELRDRIRRIAERQMASIDDLLQQGHGAREFDSFLSGLRNNIHPNINPVMTRMMYVLYFFNSVFFILFILLCGLKSHFCL